MVKPMIWKRENCLKGKIPNLPGIYKFYDKNGKIIYVGRAKRLRKRIQTYYQRDNLYEHDTKLPLRLEIRKFSYKVVPYRSTMAYEKKLKIKYKPKYNYW